MTYSVIDIAEAPAWLMRRAGMYRPGGLELERSGCTIEEPGAFMLNSSEVEAMGRGQTGDNCLPASDNGHTGPHPVLNPDVDTIVRLRQRRREEGNTRPLRVMFIYESMSYVTDEVRIDERIKNVRTTIGPTISSRYWTLTELQPGFYGAEAVGTPVHYEMNPGAAGDRALILNAEMVSRMSGVMALREPGFQTFRPDTEVQHDDGMAQGTWVATTWISPRVEHMPVRSRTEVETIDWQALPTDQQIARLEGRFEALVERVARRAVERDWCGEYEESCEYMGLSDEDASRTRGSRERNFQVSLDLYYTLGASTLEDVLNTEFDEADHSVMDEVTVVSRVRLTVNQRVADGDLFNNEAFDWDEELGEANYGNYDSVEFVDYEEV